MESKSYLPTRQKDAYGDLADLSDYGKEVRSHLAGFANLLPQGTK
jgi:hypothetical protein